MRGPHLLCKLDSSCCFVHADTSSCSPESELRRPEHKSQGRGGSWLRTSLPPIHGTLSSDLHSCSNTQNVGEKKHA